MERAPHDIATLMENTHYSSPEPSKLMLRRRLDFGAKDPLGMHIRVNMEGAIPFTQREGCNSRCGLNGLIHPFVL